MAATLTYPIGAIRSLQVGKMNRVLADEFESGATATRRVWNDREFKRLFRVEHAPLSRDELDYLEGFYARRNGGYDAFWFRDNVFRNGNAEVRFAAKPLVYDQLRGERRVSVELEEIAPIQPLATLSEVKLASTFNPIFYWDANRVGFYQHAGAVISENYVHCPVGLYQPVWTPGTLLPGNRAAQWQHFEFTGGYHAVTPDTIPISSGQPPCTIFCFARNSASSTYQVLFGFGTMGNGSAMGIALNNANQYEPWMGSFVHDWTGARYTNTTTEWRSLAVIFTNGTNDVTLVRNASVVGSINTNTRNISPGPGSLGAAMDGTSAVNAASGYLNKDLAHVLAWSSQLSLTQIKEVHNLFCGQFGLPVIV